MSEKKLKTRIQQKTDTKANWDKAVNFVPLKGEYIYYSDLNRVKVGDGVTKLSELPFITSINDIANGFSLNSQSDIVWNDSGHQNNWEHVPLPWNYGGLHWGNNLQPFNPSLNCIDVFASEKDRESLDLIIRFGGDYTDAIKVVHDLTNAGGTYPSLTLSADGRITCTGITAKNSYGENVFGNTKINGSFSVGGKNVLTDHQLIKTLKTDNTAAQTPSANESIAGSGTINLHKVAKTGSYNDLNDKPDLSAYQSKGDYVLAKNGSIAVSNDGKKFTAGYVDGKTGETENVLWIDGSSSSFGYDNIKLSILPGATRPNVWVKNENNEWETYSVICTPDVYTKTESDEKYQSKGSYATLDGNGKVPLSQLPSYVGTITSVTAGSGISIETSDDGTVKISCSYSDGDMETY